jgi:general secretion pathway protein A
MYETFFGLKNKPFNLTSDPAFLFLTPQHREALAGLAYALLARKGLVVLTGKAGTGKTTLLCKVLQQLPATRLRSSVILNPTLTAAEFVEMLLLKFGVSTIPTSKAQRIWLLEKLLIESRSRDQVVALIVDEAHKLNAETLEEIRLLSNFESNSEKLLQIVLIGQPELGTLLNDISLYQLKQRIPLRLSIRPLAPTETQSYIDYRWKVAGGLEDAPFGPEAIDLIAHYSEGIGRLINAICDNALTTALGNEHRIVEPGDVRAAISELDLCSEESHYPSFAGDSGFAHGPGAAITEREEVAKVIRTQRSSTLGRWPRKFGPSNGTGGL